MQKYKYIANLDIDEIIVPQNFSTWSEMMETVSKEVRNKKVITRVKPWLSKIIYSRTSNTMILIGNLDLGHLIETLETPPINPWQGTDFNVRKASGSPNFIIFNFKYKTCLREVSWLWILTTWLLPLMGGGPCDY